MTDPCHADPMRSVNNRLIGEFDARIWADIFTHNVKNNARIASDPETMVAWFSGAIMAGYDHAIQQNDPADLALRLSSADALAEVTHLEGQSIADDPQAIQAIGYLEVELVRRCDGDRAGVPEWFPTSPQWLELWRQAVEATKIPEINPSAPVDARQIKKGDTIHIDSRPRVVSKVHHPDHHTTVLDLEDPEIIHCPRCTHAAEFSSFPKLASINPHNSHPIFKCPKCKWVFAPVLVKP